MGVKMKKTLIFAVTLLLCFSTWAESTKLTIKNTVGGDLDEMGDYDLCTKSTETDINDQVLTQDIFGLGDRLQIDFESKFLDARFRLDTLYNYVNSSYESSDEDEEEIPDLLFVPTGFLHFKPIKQFGLVFGNDYNNYFAIPSAYLAAADDTTKYGRLLTNSLGYEAYYSSGDVGVMSKGFAFGATSTWKWGSFYDYYAKFAGGATVSSSDAAIDFGANVGVEQFFDLGFTAHDLTSSEKKYGIFAGLTAVNNLILNAGFYYNFTDSDYLPEEQVTRSDDDDNDVYEYKKQTTKYAMGLSAGYNFRNIGLSIYGDFISGLTNEYIGNKKYYVKYNGEMYLLSEDTSTIVRGETYVKYKYKYKKKTWEAVRTDEFTENSIPLYAQLRICYDINEFVETQCSFKLRTMINNSDDVWYTIYPRVGITLPNNAGKVAGGVRIDLNKERHDGITSISFPLSYTYKFKKKF